ncbi:MAG: helix-turn-helix domain-containing protein [Acinetobacter sp.]|nr:helix-turn-helix domain-containing protein [Acinetobacter sp.]
MNNHVQDDPRFITALARGLNVLSCFQSYQTYLTHQQICERTALPKATVTRLLFTLVQLNYVRYHQTQGVYCLGERALALASQGEQRHIAQLEQRQFVQFAERYQVSVNLATIQGHEMVYLACCRSSARIAVNLQVGSCVPIASTAIGRAFYATSTSQEQAYIQQLLQQQYSPSEAKNMITSLLQCTDFYHKNSYSVSDGDYADDILAVAVALPRDDTATRHYALNASVPRSLWQKDDLISHVVPALQQFALQLGQQLTFYK